MLLELGLEALEQRERVGSGTGKTGQHLIVIELANLACRRFDDDVAERDLAIAADRHQAAATHADDGGAVKVFHAAVCADMAAGFNPAVSAFRWCGPSPSRVR